ncbi:hypothetical protein F406_gp103 [Agrobacterium phage 7-7-1]|uniref:GcrA cell cycle regulator n=1 Tax=Agrobacterium phage 7-7-1 TaxID=1161931 RepID=J7F9D5_9CAUD|nr:hypothetical protein F406_gp103 [Agrobacterium phage 7-7-1]AFH19712.1 hypothetical protein 7-7-1_00014 [Agrobacterium phage 7-7-1]
MKTWAELTISEKIGAITRAYSETHDAKGDCAGIAEALGTTKAAIAGFYNRNRDELKHVPLRGKLRLNTEKELQRKRGGIKEPAPPPPPPPEGFTPKNPVTLLDIEDDGCRYIVEVHRAGLSLFCNEPAKKKFGYCTYHSKLNYTPAQEISHVRRRL